MTILIIDDEKTIRWSLGEGLRNNGFDILEAASGEEGLQLFADKSPDCVLLDMRLPGIDGLEVLRRMRKENTDVPVIVMTAYGEVDKAVEAMKLGSFDFVTKPFMIEKMKVSIEHALTTTRLRSQLRSLERSRGEWESNFVGKSTAMQDVFRVVRKIGQSKATTVLITGESGTGKELVARAIHEASSCEGPFVEINCGALPEPLLESELFGHEKGAFTDAKARKRGLVEVAEGGTLFLDEIGEMGLTLQTRLLRVIENKTFRRVGGVEDLGVRTRIVAATNRNLEQAVEEGAFRKDLYYRLKVIPIELPSLRQRLGDVALIANYFIEHYNHELNKHVHRLSPEVTDILQSYGWPGNVRELKNVIERAMLLEAEEDILPQHLPVELVSPNTQVVKHSASVLDESFKPTSLRVMEYFFITKTLEATNGNKSQAAKLLGISRQTLREKLKGFEGAQTGAAHVVEAASVDL
ncbi:MAG TPA: sigma-54 dependent transcriptional regulator [Candidatus Krumholzibacteria bacterium]|nr:sigma-54 dependent transcriptional regulator [Candidatus Krumholzibacteria bacterium]